MKRLIFVNRYFFPDHSATSQILSDLSFHLAQSGREVHVITSPQLYDNPAARLAAEECVRGVHVHRVTSTNFGRSTLLGRGLDYASFYASTSRALLGLASRDDVIVAKTDPPLISVPAMLAARRRGAKLINWLQDIYPEIAVQLGVPLLKGPLRSGVSWLRDQSLKYAATNVVVGEQMAGRLASLGIASDHIRVVQNWCDDETIRPLSRAENPLLREWGLEDKFIVGYSGNLGRAHEFMTMLDAAEAFRDNPHVVFLMIGGGHLFSQLALAAKARGLERSFKFFDYQTHEVLKYSLCVPHVHWISLRREVEGLIVPSKFLGIAASGRPMIAITSKNGEVARLVQRFDCGFVVEPGDTKSLVDALVTLKGNSNLAEAMGQRARQMLEAHFTRRQALQRWSAALDAVL